MRAVGGLVPDAACISAFFSVSRRVIEMISAMASSTTLRVFENGALKTMTPCSEAAARSIWLVPMQNAPIATRLSAASSTRAVTFVFDRMPSRATPAISAISSSSDSARVSERTLNPACGQQRVGVGVDLLEQQHLHGMGRGTAPVTGTRVRACRFSLDC